MPTYKRNKEQWTYPVDPPFNDMKFRKMYLQYRTGLHSLYKKADMAGVLEASEDVPVALKDIYVPLRLDDKEIIHITNSEEVEQIKGVSIEDVLCSDSLIAISGMPGSGKSTLTRFLADALSQTTINPTAKRLGRRIVVPFILRELNFADIRNFDDLWKQWIRDMSIRLEIKLSRDFFDYYIKNNWAVVIFDGIDELGDKQNRQLLDWIKLWIYSGPFFTESQFKTNVIIAGRPSGFIAHSDHEKYFHKFHLQPFNQKEIEEFSRKWFAVRYSHDKIKMTHKTDDFIEAVKRYQGLAELKHRPIYLSMLAYVAETSGELPRGRTLAYSKMIDAYIHQLELLKQLNEKKGFVKEHNWSYEDKIRIIEELAYKIHSHADTAKKENLFLDAKQMHIQIDRDTLKIYFNEILRDGKFDSIHSNETSELISYFLSRTGLLIEPKEDFVQFSHLTFQEFLTAKRIHRKQSRTGLIKYLKRELFDRLAGTGWHEVALLFFGIDTLSAGEDQSFILRHVINKNELSHYKFLIDLFATTDHTLSEEEVTQWLKTVVYLWVVSEKAWDSLYQNFADSIQRDNSPYGEKMTREMLCYIENIADLCLDDKDIYNDRTFISKGAEDDSATSLALQLESLSKEIDSTRKLERILRIGFYWKEIREEYLKETTIAKLPQDMRNWRLACILDAFVPFSKRHSELIASEVLSKITLGDLYRFFGRVIFWGPFRSRSSLHRVMFRIILIANIGLIYVLPVSKKSKKLIKNSLKDLFKIREMDNDITLKMLKEIDNNRLMMAIINKQHHAREIYMIIRKIAASMDNPFDFDKGKTFDIARYMTYVNLHIYDNLINKTDKAVDRSMEALVEVAKAIAYLMSRDIIHKMADDENPHDNTISSLAMLLANIGIFDLHTASMQLAKRMNLHAHISKNEYIRLLEIFQTDEGAIQFFENECGKLDDLRKEEIKEWLNIPSSPRYLLNFIIENRTYDEFDSNIVYHDFHESIKEFVRKNEYYIEKIQERFRGK